MGRLAIDKELTLAQADVVDDEFLNDICTDEVLPDESESDDESESEKATSSADEDEESEPYEDDAEEDDMMSGADSEGF